MVRKGSSEAVRAAELYGHTLWLYIVRMKRVTASEARKHWFRLLDEVVSGEVVVLERKGRRVVLRREDNRGSLKDRSELDYSKLLRISDADHADQWTWEWQGEEKALTPARRGAR